MTSRSRRSQSGVQVVALVVSLVFLLVGILGFVPDLATSAERMRFAGPGSEAELLGVFRISILNNLVHLVSGVAGIAMARTMFGALGFLITGGLLYIFLWVYGLVIEQDSAANIIALNSADNWLHLGIGASMVLIGFSLGTRT